MSLKLIQSSVDRMDIKTRRPFKYGIATMAEVPHVSLSVTVQADGTEAVGRSADHLPPKWFTKERDKPVEKEISEMEALLE